MAVRYGKFEIPSKIVFEESKTSDTYAEFVAEPFERGYGHTIGNSLRRVMLTSLEAPCIVSVTIEGVPHEYMAIEGVIEDVTNILLNVKGACLRLPSEEGARHSRILTNIVEVTKKQIDSSGGQVSVTLGDVIEDPYFEVMNPDLHLFYVTAPFKRQIDFKVAVGRGYVTSDRIPEYIDDSAKQANEIILDAIFSPVRLVNYRVENTRVGQDTDFDKLILQVTTDGRISPAEALNFASQICVKHYDVFNNIIAETLSFEEGEVEVESGEDDILDKLALRIDEIELSVRSTNCLSGADIATIAELVTIPERRMLEFRNFGKKSLNEIKAKLYEMGLSLGMDLSKHGIDNENVTETVQKYVEERNKRNEQANYT
jgi:DNA-directed RNA polymerase subunit alpha